MCRYILCGSSVSNLPLFEFHPAHVICSQSRYVDVLSSWEFMYLYICKQIVWDEIWSSYRSYHRYLWDRGRTTKMAQKPWFYHQLKLLDYPVYITINFYCSESPSLSANANTSMNLPCFPRKFVHFFSNTFSYFAVPRFLWLTRGQRTGTHRCSKLCDISIVLFGKMNAKHVV
jgi:hypothetical protein